MKDSIESYDCLYIVLEFVDGKTTNYCKIGLCKEIGNIEKRLSMLQNGNPRRLIFARIYRVENAFEVEQYLHGKYDTHRQVGEWFKIANHYFGNIDKIILNRNGKIIYADNNRKEVF